MSDALTAVVKALTDRGWHITFAESCTAGMAAAHLVDCPHVSSIFDCAFVTYANDAKIKLLGVAPSLIDQYGVVSEPVALAMAQGACRQAGAQVGVGISGIAGPGGATPTKPVGMVCFGFVVDGATHVYTCQFGDIGRARVRQSAVDFVYDTLYRLLYD